MSDQVINYWPNNSNVKNIWVDIIYSDEPKNKVNMNVFEKQYYKLLALTVNEGENDCRKHHYAGFSLPHGGIHLDLTKQSFPILSGQHLDINIPITEILGSLRGINNASWYKERGHDLWSKFAVNKTVESTVNKTDEELVNEFCSYKGTVVPTDPRYLARFTLLKGLTPLEGRKLIDKEDIPFWKNHLEIEKGDLGPIHPYLWRHWRDDNGDNIDQLRCVFDQLKRAEGNQQFTLIGVTPNGMASFQTRFHSALSAKHHGHFPCHLSHTYRTVAIPFKTRIELLIEKHPEKKMNQGKYERFPDTVGYDILEECGIPKYYLDLSWMQKNWDLMLGLPYHVMSYTLMLMMMAKLQNMIPRYLTGLAGGVQVYKNHLDAACELIHRYEKKKVPKCKPQLTITLRKDIEFIDQFELSDFTLDHYQSLPVIKFNKVYHLR